MSRVVTTLRCVPPVCLVLAGSGFLFAGFGNTWVRVGVALLLYASAVRTLAFSPAAEGRIAPARALKIWSAGCAAAGAAGGIGAALTPGPIGWLGVFVSLRFALTGAWVFRRLTLTHVPPTADQQREPV